MDYLENLSAKLYSRLKAQYPGIVEGRHRVEFNDRFKIIRFDEHQIVTGHHGTEKIWVRVKALGLDDIDKLKLEVALKNPERYYGNRKMAKTYLTKIGIGYIRDTIPGREVEIEYRLTGRTKDQDEITDALLFVFGPVVKAIKKK